MRGDRTVDDVSYTRDVTGWILTGDALDRRTVGEIQTKVIKRSGRNVVSRFFHAKSDKETISGWKIELNRILRVFNVRSVAVFTWLSLTVPFQTELAMNTHTIVSDIHRNVLKIQEGADEKHQSVSGTCTLFNME